MAVVRPRVLPKAIPCDLNDFICSVCREIYKSPRMLPCTHIFCKECLQLSTRIGSTGSICPYCRKAFHPSEEVCASEVDNKIRTGTSQCNHCDEKFPLRHMQKHLDQCCDKQLDENLAKVIGKMNVIPGGRQETERKSAIPVASGLGVERNQRRNNLRPIPATFDCPCCNIKRLSRESLLQHVVTQHKGTKPQVVCPICAAMPWGDRNLRSQNFVQHIELRHKFDYEFFVDMNKEEDAAFKDALAISMYDQGRIY